MKTLALKLWQDEAGFLVSAEMVLISTIVVLGMVVGLRKSPVRSIRNWKTSRRHSVRSTRATVTRGSGVTTKPHPAEANSTMTGISVTASTTSLAAEARMKVTTTIDRNRADECRPGHRGRVCQRRQG